MTEPGVDVVYVVVAYNSNDDLPRLLQSLLDQSSDRWRCVIADNSDVEPVDPTRIAQDPRITVQTSGRNLGYLPAARAAIHATTGRFRPLYWVVANADVELDREFTRRLAGCGADGPLCVAPSVRTSGDLRDLNPFMTTRPTVARSLLRLLQFATPWVGQRTIDLARARRRRRGAPTTPQAARRPVYAPHGSVMCLADRLMEDQDALAGAPFLYGEEVFVAERVAGLGGTVEYRPELRCTHHEHASTGVKRSKAVLRHQRRGAYDNLVAVVSARLRGRKG